MNRHETELIMNDLQEAKNMVRECQSRLTQQLLEAPKELLEAIDVGIIKPNFTVAPYFYREMKSILKQH